MRTVRETISDDVEYLVLYKTLPVWAHGYVLPFLLLYVILFSGWIFAFQGFDHLEAFFICTVAIAALNIVTCLACVWSVHVRCWMTSKKVSSLDIQQWSCVLVF